MKNRVMGEERVMTGETKLVTLRDILYVFFKNKVAISIAFLVAIICALIYCIVTPPVYRAEAKIIVRLGKAQISGVQQLPPEQYNMLFQLRSQSIRNEMELLKGEYLSEKVVKRLNEEIKAMNLRGSWIARVKDGIRTALGRSPQKAKKELITTFMDRLDVVSSRIRT